MCLLTLLLVGGAGQGWAANTHNTRSEASERQHWFGDALSPFARADVLCGPPAIPSPLTMEDVACTAYVRGANGDLVYVHQPAAAVGPLSGGDGVYWLVLHRATAGAVPGWTRHAGTHYLWQKSATQPATPSEALLVAKIVVTGGGVTNWVGMVPHSVTEALTGMVRAEDYGAVFRHGGITAVTDDDCGAAIMQAQNWLPEAGGTILLGRGACLVQTTIMLTKRVRLVGHGPAARQADGGTTLLVKAATLNGPAIQVGDHGGLNYRAASSHLQDFSLVGQNGNGGDGIVILDHNVVLERVAVYAMGQDGIRIGTDSGPRCDCNFWRLTDVKAKSNGRNGLRVQHWEDGNPPDTNGGTATLLDMAFNGDAGVLLRNTWLNTFYNVVATANVGYGLAIGNFSLYNRIHGGDLSEGNCTGGCGGQAGDLLFDGGPGADAPRANTVDGVTLFDTRVIDLTPKPYSNTYHTIPASVNGTRLRGLLSLGFANETADPTLPAATHFAARSASGELTFGAIPAGARVVTGVTVPDFTGSLKTCVCDPSTDFANGLLWQTYASDSACNVTMHNSTAVPITPPVVLWRCIGLLFPTAAP